MPTTPVIAILYLVESYTIHRVTALSNSMDLSPCVVSPSLPGLISSLDGAFEGSFVKHPLTRALYVNTVVWTTAADHINNWSCVQGMSLVMEFLMCFRCDISSMGLIMSILAFTTESLSSWVFVNSEIHSHSRELQ